MRGFAKAIERNVRYAAAYAWLGEIRAATGTPDGGLQEVQVLHPALQGVCALQAEERCPRDTGASVVAAIMLIIAFVMLLVINLISAMLTGQVREIGGGDADPRPARAACCWR